MLAVGIEWWQSHWVDMITVLSGVAYAKLARNRRANPGKIISRETGMNFVTGLALAPLFLLFLGVFFDGIMTALLQASRITLAAASAIALMSLLEDSGEDGK
jgi:hypothetical protein